MHQKSFFRLLTPALGLLVLAGCSKNVKSLDTSLAPTNGSFVTTGAGRIQVWDVTLPATAHSGKMEVTEWVSFTGPAEINVCQTAVDPGYVMVGGGAEVVDPNGNQSSIDAVLTAAYPVNDGTFSTYYAADKDHGGIHYNSDCYAYVIGIKLYDQSGNVIPTGSITQHLRYDANTSAAADHPSTYVQVPSGYEILSGGALDDYGTGYGNLLTSNYYTNPQAFASGKDQKEADVCSVIAYALSYDGQPITDYGTIQVGYQTGSVAVSQHLQGLTVSILGNYAVAGVGGESTYTGYGRLLAGVYSSSSTTGEFLSKDQDVNDISGDLYGVVTEIYPAP